MALEVGIVGLPGSGKTTLFTALTRTGGAGFGKENVGMATIADARLERLAQLVGARKVTPATIRVVDVQGTGPALLGGLRLRPRKLQHGFLGERVEQRLQRLQGDAERGRGDLVPDLDLELGDHDRVGRRAELQELGVRFE